LPAEADDAGALAIADEERRDAFTLDEALEIAARRDGRPIGAGMLGYRVGDEFEWKVPAGVRHMQVVNVDYQPEAAGDFDR
jgi:hypothetical protein